MLIYWYLAYTAIAVIVTLALIWTERRGGADVPYLTCAMFGLAWPFTVGLLAAFVALSALGFAVEAARHRRARKSRRP